MDIHGIILPVITAAPHQFIEVSGEALLGKLRTEKHCTAPVLVLSAKGSLQDKVGLLRMGADFHPQ